MLDWEKRTVRKHMQKPDIKRCDILSFTKGKKKNSVFQFQTKYSFIYFCVCVCFLFIFHVIILCLFCCCSSYSFQLRTSRSIHPNTHFVKHLDRRWLVIHHKHVTSVDTIRCLLKGIASWVVRQERGHIEYPSSD